MMTKTKTRKPERIVNDAPRTFTDADFPVGTVAHQGDLILVRIEALPKSAKHRANTQMADGDTQGSRHIVTRGYCHDCDADEVVKAIKKVCPKSEVSSEFIGPVFQTKRGMAELDHPEHGNLLWEGNMVIVCVVQRNLDAEERAVRARD